MRLSLHRRLNAIKSHVKKVSKLSWGVECPNQTEDEHVLGRRQSHHSRCNLVPLKKAASHAGGFVVAIFESSNHVGPLVRKLVFGRCRDRSDKLFRPIHARVLLKLSLPVALTICRNGVDHDHPNNSHESQQQAQDHQCHSSGLLLLSRHTVAKAVSAGLNPCGRASKFRKNGCRQGGYRTGRQRDRRQRVVVCGMTRWFRMESRMSVAT